jgi:transcriptional regulator with XRE-family HTH domain
MERNDYAILKFGERVKDLRLAKDWSQTDLGYEVGVDPQTIRRIEKGRQDPSLSIIVALAQALGCKIDDLITEDLLK